MPSALRLRRKGKAPYSPYENSTFAQAQNLQPRSPFATDEKRESVDDELDLVDDGLDDDANAEPCVRVDVLNWLGRATLDVIGLAGFGYAFDALVDDQNVLAAAFAEVFSAARQLRFITVLQAWFPILHYFVSTCLSARVSPPFVNRNFPGTAICYE